MSNLIPKELKEDMRLFTVPYLNIHYTSKGAIYGAIATGISAIILKFSNVIVFLIFFVILNAVAYPIGHGKINKNKLDCGNLSYDKYLLRKYLYKKNKKNQVYIRRRKS